MKQLRPTPAKSLSSMRAMQYFEAVLCDGKQYSCITWCNHANLGKPCFITSEDQLHALLQADTSSSSDKFLQASDVHSGW